MSSMFQTDLVHGQVDAAVNADPVQSVLDGQVVELDTIAFILKCRERLRFPP